MKKQPLFIKFILISFSLYLIIPLSQVNSEPQINYEHEYKEGSVIANFNTADVPFIDYLASTYDLEINNLYGQTKNIVFDHTVYSINYMLNILNNYPQINYAEPDYVFKQLASPTQEPLYSQQWAYTNNIFGINIWNVWNETLGSEDVVVAVVDTGIYYTHPDFVRRIWTNPNEIADNGLDDDENGYIDDYYGWDFGDINNDPVDESGHGTFIAGIIAGAVNDYGITGTAPGVKLMALKVENSEKEIYLNRIISAVNYGLSHNVRIFNMSFVSDHYSIELRNLLESADAIFICGAGNEGTNNDVTPYYPASYNLNNVISVTSINSDGQLSWFSNYGPTSVHIAAPGENIISTYVPSGYHYHAIGQGTSFAAPFVAGVAALLLSKDPTLTPQEVRTAILNSVKTLAGLDGVITTGGILDAYAAYTYYDPHDVLGDLNGDNLVTLSDLIILRRHLAGIELINELYLSNADINGDGLVTLSDLIKLRRFLAGLEDL